MIWFLAFPVKTEIADATQFATEPLTLLSADRL
jgi:hypothetical protein